jgi:hypothetical protein
VVAPSGETTDRRDPEAGQPFATPAPLEATGHDTWRGSVEPSPITSLSPHIFRNAGEIEGVESKQLVAVPQSRAQRDRWRCCDVSRDSEAVTVCRCRWTGSA